MRLGVFISTITILVLLAAAMVAGSGCANIIPPQGGPRDSLAPVLLKSDPGDSTRNFRGDKITFTFDEYVEVQNISDNLLVSPLPKNPPVVDYKLRTVTLKIKDSLEANTTYSFNFGSAIRDFNEGNPYKNFTYTFSTGAYLDSLELTGSVVLAETGKVDTSMIIMLHTSADDSALIKDKPRYITRLDGKGNFHFKNLPARTFYIYALKDDGNTRRYLSNKQLFAFADAPVTTGVTKDSIKLLAWAQPSPAASNPGAAALAARNAARGANRNTPDRRLRFQTTVENGTQDLLENLEIRFDLPLKQFDSSKLKLFTDSSFVPVNGASFRKDSTNKKIILDLGKDGWKPNTLYQLILDKDFAEDSSGKRLLKSDTLSFTTKKQSDYGSLKLKFRGMDMSINPVVQFLINGTIVKTYPISSPELSIALIVPGEYELRILGDTNKNGTWDPGQFFGKKRQPEIVRPIERKINVKGGWQNEFELQSPK